MEIDNLGFNLYRADAPAGPFEKLNGSLIPAQLPGQMIGGQYGWMDRTVEPGRIYYYRLEDLDLHGVSTYHGPISATGPRTPSAVLLTGFAGSNGRIAGPPAVGLWVTTLLAAAGYVVSRRR